MQAPECIPIRILPAEPYPHPVRPVAPAEWTKTRVDQLWKYVSALPNYLDDFQKGGGHELLLGSLASGDIRAFEIGQNDGLILAYDIAEKLSSTIECFFWGNKRKFLEEYGSLSEVRYVVLRYLYDQANVRRFRVRLDPLNLRGQRFAKRCKFKYEGTVRMERVVSKKAVDTMIFGLLSSENEE